MTFLSHLYCYILNHQLTSLWEERTNDFFPPLFWRKWLFKVIPLLKLCDPPSNSKCWGHLGSNWYIGSVFQGVDRWENVEAFLPKRQAQEWSRMSSDTWSAGCQLTVQRAVYLGKCCWMALACVQWRNVDLAVQLSGLNDCNFADICHEHLVGRLWQITLHW